MSGARLTLISSPGGQPGDTAPAHGEARVSVRLHTLSDSGEEQSAEGEQVVLERLLLSSLATGEADQP